MHALLEATGQLPPPWVVRDSLESVTRPGVDGGFRPALGNSGRVCVIPHTLFAVDGTFHRELRRGKPAVNRTQWTGPFSLHCMGGSRAGSSCLGAQLDDHVHGFYNQTRHSTRLVPKKLQAEQEHCLHME